MVIFGKWNQHTITLSLKANSLTLSLQSQGSSQVYSFDGEGRLWTAMREGISYRRGLNGRTVAKWQTGGDGRERRWLSEVEAGQLEEQARQTMENLLADLNSGAVALQSPLPASAPILLRNAAHFTPQ